MASLIIALPSTATRQGTEYPYAVTQDGNALTDHGTAPATLLPQCAELVVVVPARQLSWHRATLPKVAAGRLQEALVGVLEEHLLDDPQSVHFAIEPTARASLGSGESVWVAACDKAWLRAALQALEEAGRTVTRVVPELVPGPAQWWIHGTPGSAWCAQVSTNGVAVLPLAASLGRPAGELYAEPAVATPAEQALGLKVTLRSAAQQLVLAAQSPWNLAQFDLASAGRSGAGKKLTHAWQQLSQSAGWRPFRWGLAALLLIQLVALNAWAWRERASLDEKRERIRSLFVQTFPQTPVVIDPVRQMTQQVSAMQRAAGQLSPRDLEVMLAQLGAVLPESRTPGALDYTPGELSLKALDLNTQEFANAQSRLQAEGYSLQNRDGRLLLRSGPPEARP